MIIAVKKFLVNLLVNLSVIPVEWNNCKINLIDVPGTFDFTGECESALSVCESALIIVPSSSGINAGTKQAMYKAKDKAKNNLY